MHTVLYYACVHLKVDRLNDTRINCDLCSIAVIDSAFQCLCTKFHIMYPYHHSRQSVGVLVGNFYFSYPEFLRTNLNDGTQHITGGYFQTILVSIFSIFVLSMF